MGRSFDQSTARQANDSQSPPAEKPLEDLTDGLRKLEAMSTCQGAEHLLLASRSGTCS